jgi:hypothetical protein
MMNVDWTSDAFTLFPCPPSFTGVQASHRDHTPGPFIPGPDRNYTLFSLKMAYPIRISPPTSWYFPRTHPRPALRNWAGGKGDLIPMIPYSLIDHFIGNSGKLPRFQNTLLILTCFDSSFGSKNFSFGKTAHLPPQF